MSAPVSAQSPPTVPLVLQLGKGTAPLLSPALLQPPAPLPQCPQCWSANLAAHPRLAALGYLVLGLIAFLSGFFVLMVSYLAGNTYVGDLIWLVLLAVPIVLYLREHRSLEGRIWAERGLHCFNCGNQWLHQPGAPEQPRRLEATLPREVNDRLRDIQRRGREDQPGPGQ